MRLFLSKELNRLPLYFGASLFSASSHVTRLSWLLASFLFSLPDKRKEKETTSKTTIPRIAPRLMFSTWSESISEPLCLLDNTGRPGSCFCPLITNYKYKYKHKYKHKYKYHTALCLCLSVILILSRLNSNLCQRNNNNPVDFTHL